MSSEFFEKLKKGMDIENAPKEDSSEKEPVLEQDYGTEQPEIVTQQSIEEAAEEAVLDENPMDEMPAENSEISLASVSLAGESARKASKKRVPARKRKSARKEGKSSGEKIRVRQESVLGDDLNDDDGAGVFRKDGQLTVDVFETENYVFIQSAVAGITPEDLDITIEKDMVSIRGKRERQLEEKAENFVYQECYWGRFSREIVLPAEVDKSGAEASMKNGILTIKIPKIEGQDTKRLDINIE